MRILWDEPGAKVYETGIDRGVLYLPTGQIVPWSGLTALDEKFSNNETVPLFFDGIKYYDLAQNENFAATLKVFTYPDEFLPYEGVVAIAGGLFVKDQSPKRFSLSYRTHVGNDLNGTAYGYKIHILCNLMATPQDIAYSTLSEHENPVEFAWDLSSIPQPVTGFRPTAHAIIDTRYLNRFLLRDLEEFLYGSEFADPKIPSITELTDMVAKWELISIVDHGDGIATITGPDELIYMIGQEDVQIDEINAAQIDEQTIRISTTYP